MDNFDLTKYLAEGRLLKEEYNLPDSDSTTDKYVNNHWDSILKDILRAHTDLRNSKGGESIPERPSQLDIDIVLGRFDGADEFTDVDPSVYEEYFDFYDMYLVTQRDEENTKSISDEDYPKGNYDGYTKRDDLPKLSEGVIKEDLVDFEGNDMYQEIKGDMKRYYKMDVSMDVIKDWADDYFPNRKDEDGIEYEFETSAREDFLNHLEDLKDSNASDEDKELQKQVDIQAKSARRVTSRTRDLAMAKGLSMDDYFDSIAEGKLLK